MFCENHPSTNNGFILILPHMHTDFNFPLHIHKNYEFIFVEEGCLIAEINGFDYKLCKGEGVLILSNQPHRYTTPEHSKSWTLLFSSDVIPELKQIVKKCPFSPIIRLNNPDTRAMLLKNKNNPLRMRSILYDLVAIYCEGEPAPHLISDDGDVTVKIMQYISDHYAEPLTLKEISHSLGYNYRYISGIVNKLYKLPFPSIINSHRIHRSCALLDKGENTITEISMLCGFGSTRSFNRNFKSIMGITPKEYINKTK
ncbi:MAG: helix-turn-helix transcriptional regulator [Clostridia bacterium]|nr:helix-turn-helix transcriptional regulator [Clostridia bacterium]